jgi:hypothetical protein
MIALTDATDIQGTRYRGAKVGMLWDRNPEVLNNVWWHRQAPQ